MRRSDVQAGLVFSDEQYCGDVPYLGGNTNITVEQVAGIVGKTGFHLLAGLEGGYVAEQLSGRSGAKVHKTELLQLADEVYPVAAERIEDVLQEANGGTMPDRIALLTPRQVIPASLVEYMNRLFGAKNVIDCFEPFARVKYEKSEREMELIRDASVIGDAVMSALLAVLEPGMLETQVAAWGYFVAKELGAEELGFDIMVGANEANRSLIGKALESGNPPRGLGAPGGGHQARRPELVHPAVGHRGPVAERGHGGAEVLVRSGRRRLQGRLQEVPRGRREAAPRPAAGTGTGGLFRVATPRRFPCASARRSTWHP